MKIDGGPAFSMQWQEIGFDDVKIVPTSPGMSLRDYIAIHASDDDVRDFNVRRNNGEGPFIGRAVARYEFADAMLKAREADDE